MELTPNMYVRTKNGISKIKEVCKREYDDYPICIIETPIFDLQFDDRDISCDGEFVTIDGNLAIFDDEDIIKASHNIIDLIEVGDYVNGELVTSAEDVYTTDNIYIGREVIVKHSDVIIEEEIETIVTKEQFSAMEYKID